MGNTSTGTGIRNALADYLLGTVLTTASENRKAVEIKWNRNRALRYADAALDPKGTWKAGEKKGKWKSDTFFAIARQKIVAAHSIIYDALFKDGKTPIQTLLQQDGEETEAIEQDPVASVFADNQVEWENARLARQLKACNATRELSMALDDDLTYGECWVHNYEMEEVEAIMRPIAPGIMAPDERRRSMLAIEHVSPWEMFYDLESGPDSSSWSYLMRQQRKSPADLAKLDDGGQLFNLNAIKRVLDPSEKHHGEPNQSSGSGDTSTPPKTRNLPKIQKTVWVREWFADVPTEKLLKFEAQWEEEMATGETATESPESEGGTGSTTEEARPWDVARIWAITADNEVIAYQRDPQTTYFRAECEPNNDEPFGVGIADKMEFVTKVLNGMIRSYENNAKLLSNLVAAVKRELMVTDPEQALGNEGGIIDLDESCTDARMAIQQITFQSILDPLTTGITMMLEFADYESQLPRAEQGAQGGNPQTAFELQQRLERSGKYLGGVIQRFDYLVEKGVGAMSVYNQTNPDEQKGIGNFRVIATGFSSFQNQVIRLQKLLQTLNMIVASEELSRIHKISWLLREIYKAQDIDPDQLLKSPEEQSADDEAASQSEQMQLNLALLKAQVAVAEARARKDEASAQEILASMETAAQDSDTNRMKANTERARAVADIEDKVIARSQPQETEPLQPGQPGKRPVKKAGGKTPSKGRTK